MTGLMVSMLAFVAGVKDKLESDEKAQRWWSTASWSLLSR